MNKNKKILYCVNCNKDGHNFKLCSEPIISYGIILISINFNDSLNQKILDNIILSKNLIDSYDNNIYINDYNDIELFCVLKNYIKFLLIKRKHSLGFLEFIRGRYNIDNVDGIIFLFKQMTPHEINKITIYSFDELWDEVWGDNKEMYINEYSLSKDKFNKLKNYEDGYLSLKFYIENVIPTWNNTEWGFPKGRRNVRENDKNCAIREFMEETGFDKSDFVFLDNIDPLEEKFC